MWQACKPSPTSQNRQLPEQANRIGKPTAVRAVQRQRRKPRVRNHPLPPRHQRRWQPNRLRRRRSANNGCWRTNAASSLTAEICLTRVGFRQPETFAITLRQPAETAQPIQAIPICPIFAYAYSNDCCGWQKGGLKKRPHGAVPTNLIQRKNYARCCRFVFHLVVHYCLSCPLLAVQTD